MKKFIGLPPCFFFFFFDDETEASYFIKAYIRSNSTLNIDNGKNLLLHVWSKRREEVSEMFKIDYSIISKFFCYLLFPNYLKTFKFYQYQIN